MIPRTITEAIARSIDTKPVTLITGARQVGKTFLCKKFADERGLNYVTLADRQNRELANKDPDAFLKFHGMPLIIDEIQYAPKLFDSIESVVDRELFDNDKAHGLFILTGSQTFKMMEGVTQSMAGRVGVIRMSGLSISEINRREEIPFVPEEKVCFERSREVDRDIVGVFEDIIRGSYPELHNKPDIVTWEFYSDYVDTYISRDVSLLINIQDQMNFMNFMQVVASLTGQELSYETISNAVGIDTRTVKKWLSVLIAGDIVFLQQPYFGTSTVKRITKRPKIYFRDTGLACYLARISDARSLMGSYLKGPMAETYIVNEIMKTYTNKRLNVSFNYYRDSNGNEIDLVIQKNGKLDLVECKGGIECGKDDTNAMTGLKGDINSMCIVCMTKSPYPIKDGIYAIPVTSL